MKHLGKNLVDVRTLTSILSARDNTENITEETDKYVQATESNQLEVRIISVSHGIHEISGKVSSRRKMGLNRQPCTSHNYYSNPK